MSTDTAVHCARHPRVETALTCASCGTPICPRCMVTTPVGMKCPDCGRSKNSVLFSVRPERFALAGVTALLAGVAAGIIGGMGFLIIFISIPYGYFAGTMILKASGMKRGPKMEVLAGAGMVLGALALKLLPALMFTGQPAILIRSLISPFFWIAVTLATSCAVSKIRYL